MRTEASAAALRPLGPPGGPAGLARSDARPLSVRALAAAGALVGTCGLGLQLVISFRLAAETGEPVGTVVIGFLSFFTNLSNLAAVISLVCASSPGRFHGRVLHPRVQAGVAQYMAITGLVFVLVLRPSGPLPADERLASSILHHLMPLVFLACWAAGPRRGELAQRDLAWWLVFPLSFLTWTLAHGAAVNWYPYAFLDVRSLGYGGVTLASGVLLVVFVLFGRITIDIDHALARRATARRTTSDPLPEIR
jgi:hypothetical protein